MLSPHSQGVIAKVDRMEEDGNGPDHGPGVGSVVYIQLKKCLNSASVFTTTTVINHKVLIHKGSQDCVTVRWRACEVVRPSFVILWRRQ